MNDACDDDSCRSPVLWMVPFLIVAIAIAIAMTWSMKLWKRLRS